MHKILLNSVLLFHIVSSGVRPKLPGQTPIGHNSLVFCRSWVGCQVGSGVRVVSVFNKSTRRVLSYDVLQQQKTGVMTKGSWPPFVSGVLYSSPSQTLRRRVVLCEQRTTDAAVSAQRLPPFVAALFFTLRDSYGWQHCRPVCSEARYSSRIAFLPTPPAFDAPPPPLGREGSVGISPSRLAWKN